MHYLWSVFSPVIFAAIGKQFLRVWGYIRSLQWLPSVKNRLRCPLCKQLCKQIGGYGVPRQIISQTRHAGVTDWYKQTDGGLRSLYRGPVCLLCATSVIATSILDRPEITDGFQICTRLHLLSRLQSDDILALINASVVSVSYHTTLFVSSGRPIVWIQIRYIFWEIHFL